MFFESIIAFIGATDFAAGFWIGIELDASEVTLYEVYLNLDKLIRKVPTKLVFLSA